MADTRLIGGIHYEMMRSCYNPKSMLYQYRGALGIKVCDEWHDREKFREWCKDQGFKTGMQLLRHNATKDFCPENCYISEPKNRKNNQTKRKNIERAKKNKEKKAALNIKNWTDTPIVNTYNGIHYRCENKNCYEYDRYGGRGITVCEEWSGKNGKYNFVKWALDHGWEHGLSLDRIDNNKGYSPDNCRWTTSKEQARNRRNTLFHLYNGEYTPVIEIAEKENVDYNKLRHRLRRKNANIIEIINELKGEKWK